MRQIFYCVVVVVDVVADVVVFAIVSGIPVVMLVDRNVEKLVLDFGSLLCRTPFYKLNVELLLRIDPW